MTGEGIPDVMLAQRIAAQRDGWTLDQDFYTSPAIFQRDLERIFRRHWLFAGALCRIPKAGDYFLYEVANESIIVMRGEGEQVHALFNVCRHRGSRILLEPCGHAERLICPYHQWMYAQDGSLTEARLMPPDFDVKQFGLHRAAVRAVEGLIFICLSEMPPDFDEVVSDFAPYFKTYDFAAARIAHVERHEVKANWKLIAENFASVTTATRRIRNIAVPCPVRAFTATRGGGKPMRRWKRAGSSWAWRPSMCALCRGSATIARAIR